MRRIDDCIAEIDWSLVEERSQQLGLLRQRFESATTYFGKLKAVGAYWKHYEERIIDHAKKSPRSWFTSYPLDWNLFFTPIEREAWMSIRSKGGVILYPQYPVLNFQVDFGNPYLKIALEVDGKAFHNPQRDYERDARLKDIGWKVYRVTGSEMVKRDYKDFSDFTESEAGWYYDGYDDVRNWYLKTGDGVIEAIKAIHFSNIERNRETDRFLSLCDLTLYSHCKFPH